MSEWLAEFLVTMETLPPLARGGVVIGTLILCWALEALSPRVRFQYQKVRHAFTNLGLLAINAVLQVLFVATFAGVMIWASDAQFGLLHLVELPLLVEVLIAFLALDLIAQYGMHYALHHVPWLWRLHMVHHNDTHVDATTGTRLHPLDYLSRDVAALFAVITFGIPLGVYLLYRTVTSFFTYFTHANVRLPAWLERGLRWLFVTPDVHKFHHHSTTPWTDRNFGNVLSIWDRLFGTLVIDDPAKIDYGLDTVGSERELHIGWQLALPWNGKVKSR